MFKSQITLNEVLLFWAGAENVPPTGFQQDLRIVYYTLKVNKHRFYSSSTCALQLWLPRGVDRSYLSPNIAKLGIAKIKKNLNVFHEHITTF